MINIEIEKLPINITEHIKRFRLFLISCWPHIDKLMEFHDWDQDVEFLDDWLDVNWQLLVERELLEGKGILTPLSASISDDFIYNDKKKYTIEARISEHKINGQIKFEIPMTCVFRLFGFSTKLDKFGFGLYPPFDTADLVVDQNKKIYTLPFECLDFYLVEYSFP